MEIGLSARGSSIKNVFCGNNSLHGEGTVTLDDKTGNQESGKFLPQKPKDSYIVAVDM